MSGVLGNRRYRNRRAALLATATVCGICLQARCPHCKGEARHCRGILGHVDHDKARARGGAVNAANEQAAHACCNLKKGDRDAPPEILRTSRDW